MKTCVERTHVDNLVQSIGVTQHCLSVGYHTHIHAYTEIYRHFSMMKTTTTTTTTATAKVLLAQVIAGYCYKLAAYQSITDPYIDPVCYKCLL